MAHPFDRRPVAKFVYRLRHSVFHSEEPIQRINVAGVYDGAIAPSPVGRIPNRFVQTWKTTEFDPEHATRLIKFRNSNTEFSFEFFDDAAMDRYMKKRWADHPIFEIYAGLRFGEAKADIWRYCNLYDGGGIYLDIDASIQCRLKDFDLEANANVAFEGNEITTFLDEEHSADFVWFRERQFSQPKLSYPTNPVLNWCLLFRPGHPILKGTIESIVANAPFYQGKVFSNVHKAVVNFTGPIPLTKAVWDHASAKADLVQCGIDFDGRAKFKDFPGDPSSVYRRSLNSSYHNQTRRSIYDRPSAST